jgi:hypothetical protein
MNKIPIPWPQKQRELHHHHFDSTIWNDFECGGALASTSMSVAWPPLLVPDLRLLPLPLPLGLLGLGSYLSGGRIPPFAID